MPPTPEADLLLDHLGAQRRHVLGALDGLDDQALRRPVLPSGWSCLGLVQHLALDVERFWFAAVLAGDRAVIDSLDDAGDAWQVGADVPADQVLAGYRTAVARAEQISAATPLDAAPAWWPGELFGGWRLEDHRELLLHVLTETAVHAGHLDAAVELLDGRQWRVLGG